MAESTHARILVVTRNMPPLVGGMERLNWHMVEELARHARVRVIGPEGAAAQAPRGVLMEEVSLKPLPRFLVGALWLAARRARQWRPDWIVAGSGLTAPLAWLAAKACGARTAVYLHGLDVALDNPLYRAVWLPAIRRMDRVIANSSATRQLAIDAGLNPACIGIIHPGVSLPEEERDELTARRFRDQHDLSGQPLLLSVGRLARRKGLREFVSDVLPQIAEKRSDVMLVIIGDAPIDALHAPHQTMKSIRDAADAAGVAKNLRFLGRVSEDELLAAYRASAVHVFAIQQVPGDPEGFGMVAVEAAAHGLPTVAYATGGVVDAVANGRSGILVSPGDTTAFAAAVIRLLEQPLDPAALRKHAEQFSWSRFGVSLRALLADETTSTELSHG